MLLKLQILYRKQTQKQQKLNVINYKHECASTLKYDNCQLYICNLAHVYHAYNL